MQTGVFRRRFRQPRRVAAVTAVGGPPAIPDVQPISPSAARRLYRQGGKLARRSRRVRRTLWRMTAVLAIGNLLLAMVLMVQSGPASLVERFLSIAPGTSTQVVVDGLNLRDAPGADAAVIAVLGNGQTVKVTGLSDEDEQGRWWPVEVEQDGQHLEGWVWDGGLQPNAWTGRLSWMQDIVDGAVGVKDGIGGFIDDVRGVIPGLIVRPGNPVT
jgi:hypothetical protein